jgi:hypothetical protein
MSWCKFLRYHSSLILFQKLKRIDLPSTKLISPLKKIVRLITCVSVGNKLVFPHIWILHARKIGRPKFQLPLILQWVHLFLSLWFFANRLDILWQIVLSFNAFDFLLLFSSYQFGRCCFYTNYVSISICPIATTKVEPIDPNLSFNINISNSNYQSRTYWSKH